MNGGFDTRSREQRAAQKWLLVEQAMQERMALQHLLGQWKRSADLDARLSLAGLLLRATRHRPSVLGDRVGLFLVLLPLIRRFWPNLDPMNLDSWVHHIGQQWRHWSRAWRREESNASVDTPGSVASGAPHSSDQA